ncbi:MAG: hypothetical protein ACR2NW_02995 [Thermodesulfobacteriota bacterium]
MSDNLILILAIVVFIFIFFAVIKSKIKVRSILEDYEADLNPTNLNEFSQSGRGEVERELYGDGSAALKLRFSGTNLPEGSMVTLVVNSSKAGEFQVSEGRVYEKIETRSGKTVPSVKAGDTVEVLYDGTVVLSGTFYVD